MNADSMSEAMPKISIIVPVYNSAAYLPQCLQSLQMQTLQDIEVILVDDGSADGSSEICAEAVASDARFHFFQQKNGGPTAARKLGMHHASAMYVTFLDSDDWAEPAWCQRFYEEAVKTKADLVVCQHFRDQDGVSTPQRSLLSAGTYDRAEIEHRIFPVLFHDDFEDGWTIYPYLWDKLFVRGKLLPLIEQMDEELRLGEDACTTFAYLVNCQRIVLTTDCLYHYVQHPKSGVRAQLDLKHDLPHDRWMYHFVCKSWKGMPFENLLQAQWRRYLLTTILLPRFPFLWRDEEGQDRLFPFLQVVRGSRVVIYGAGVFGTSCYRFLRTSGYAEPVLWLDRRAQALQEEGLPVSGMEALSNTSYDLILVTIMRSSIAKAVYGDLQAAGVPSEKICVLDKTIVTSELAWKAYGMNE